MSESATAHELSILGKAAVEYAERGWRVFPVHATRDGRCTCGTHPCGTDNRNAGKHPRNDHGPLDASSDPETVRRLWRACPDANIGLATGPDTGIVALDVDSYKPGAADSLRDLERQHGELPDTVVSMTGGGGTHYLFRHPGRKVNSVNRKIADSIDVKGDGGYIILPPSRHANGRDYLWELTHHPDDISPAELPAWIERVANRPTNGTGSPSDPSTRHGALLRLTMADSNTLPMEENLQRALDHPLGQELVSEGREVEIRRMVEGAYAKQNTPEPPTEDHHFTDSGNAARFVHDHGEKVRYVHDRKRWLVWTGTHWRADDTGEVRRLAARTVLGMYNQASVVQDDTKRQALVKHAMSSESRKRQADLLQMAESNEAVAITSAALDTNPWLLNCPNGTLDLETGELLAHSPADLIAHCLPVEYDPGAECPKWERFLDRVFGGDTELIAYVQRAVGYSLTGSTREQCFFFGHGPGANGKTTFLELVLSLLGDLAQSARFESFLSRREEGIPNDIARMRGVRFVTAIESSDGRRFDEGLLKSLTGGDTVTARFLHGEFFEFKPQLKLWLAANSKPSIWGTDEAIWRRVKLIPFVVTIPESERNPDLADELRLELAGVLAWAVRGCRSWVEQGLGTCDAVVAETAAYRDEQDVLAPFLDERCEVSADLSVGLGEMYRAYEAWSDRNAQQVLGKTTFGRKLTERDGIRKDRLADHGRAWVWKGVGLVVGP